MYMKRTPVHVQNGRQEFNSGKDIRFFVETGSAAHQSPLLGNKAYRT